MSSVTVTYDNRTWHSLPNLRAYGSVTFTRSNEKSSTVTYSGSITIDPEGHFYGSGYELFFTIEVGGTEIYRADLKGSNDTTTVNPGPPYTHWNGKTVNISGSLDITNNNQTIRVYMHCRLNGGPCPDGDSDVRIGNTANTSSIPYNPYTEPTMWFNTAQSTRIGRIAVTPWNVKYTYNCGTESSISIHAHVHEDSSTNWSSKHILDTVVATRSGSGEVTSSYTMQYNSGFKDGTAYRESLVATYSGGSGSQISPSQTSPWNPRKGYAIRTYQQPLIRNVVNAIGENPAIIDYTFNIYDTNNRAWTDDEQDFQTRYRINYNGGNFTEWTSLGNITSYYRSVAQMRTLVPKNYDHQQARIQFKRFSPSAPNDNNTGKGWYSTNTTEFTVTLNYRPRAGVTTANTSYKKNRATGNGIAKGSMVDNDSSLTGIYVSWNYDTSVKEAGYTQGYRIRLYDRNKSLVKTYYTTTKYFTIPKADIPKVQMTYIDITPYFGNDQPDLASATYANNYWYYNLNTIEMSQFVILVSKLQKPVITYPLQNSDWINNKFRVCFILPDDPDKGLETETTYHYEDIEVQVNGTHTYRMTANPQNRTTSGTCVQAPEIYSANASNLTYQRKMIVCPGLSTNFPSATTYSIKIRVKKKYTTTVNNWSDWSDVRTIKVTPAKFEPKRGDLIMASHYNTAKTVVDRVRKSYNVAWTTQPANVVAKTTMILRTQFPYNNLYSLIVATKNQVNNYGPFDTERVSVRFDNSNAILTNFTPSIELVTADSNESVTTGTGRDYIRIIYDRCNRLI